MKLNEIILSSDDKMKKMKIIIKNLSKEKSDFEEVMIRQETKVNELANNIKIVEKNIKDKNKEISENEENTMKLIEIIEEQKKSIENLSKNSNTNKVILTTKDEIQLKKIITEKENEITNLKLYNESIKNDLIGILIFFIF